MKFRTDFVTNSSSASFILELSFVSDDDRRADFSLAVSPEICFSDDGDMKGEGISLRPMMGGSEIYFGGDPLSSADSIRRLGGILFGAAKIDGWPSKEETAQDDEDDEDYDDYDWGQTVYVRDVAPMTISKFINMCEDNGITIQNLKTIIIKNSKSGWGDSAMWLRCDDLLNAFNEYYEKLGENRNPDMLQALIEFVKSDPALPVNDNEYNLPDEMPCVWEESDDKLERVMKKLLAGELSGRHWMGTYSDEYHVDTKNTDIENRKVLYYGSL